MANGTIPSYPRDRKVDQIISFRPYAIDLAGDDTGNVPVLSGLGHGTRLAQFAHVSASGHGNAQVSTRPPMTLGNLREQGVHHLIAPCEEDSWWHRP